MSCNGGASPTTMLDSGAMSARAIDTRMVVA